MIKIIQWFFKVFLKLNYGIISVYSKIIVYVLFYVHKVEHKAFVTKGVPRVFVSSKGSFKIGNNFKMNNVYWANPIGREKKCLFVVGEGANLMIGENVGVSFVSIVCRLEIKIGNNVKIGGNVCIYDTDFHSLNFLYRRIKKQDNKETKNKPVKINDDVFIGAHSIILKGVEIGEKSIIGAGSVVSKSVPKGEIWAGNPAKFIRNI
ncbi:acyltransferase [Thalassobellus suaedae]|uniref:Acyltransferase n=1 Tax=Thalassobellus suaedae TaxID=3074124 RepID=A0ABY9XRQ3_9FLAO|nr:acyltransferase [Flavobacteriaceae bacterium HL-DH14]